MGRMKKRNNILTDESQFYWNAHKKGLRDLLALRLSNQMFAKSVINYRDGLSLDRNPLPSPLPTSFAASLPPTHAFDATPKNLGWVR